MKKLIIISLFVAIMYGCDKPPGPYTGFETVFRRSFVGTYVGMNGILLRETKSYLTDKRGISISEKNRYVIGTFESTGARKEAYDALCVKHNDMTFNREHEAPWGGISALGVDFISVDIISNADFDDNHLAGTSLADVVMFECRTLKPFIDGGYVGLPYFSTVVKRLASEITSEDMSILYGDIGTIWFENPPTLDKIHYFTVTMTADDGRVFSDTIRMTFE